MAQGVGGAVESVSEVFTVNKTKAELALQAQAMASLNQYGAEFSNGKSGKFNSFINGINRLPRPVMALGTVGLFVFAMANPANFATRMQGLAFVPDPLWWLLGAVVSFYFGARELHYARDTRVPVVMPVPQTAVNDPRRPTLIPVSNPSFSDNAALAEWAALDNQAA
jgi:hypothetical protein